MDESRFWIVLTTSFPRGSSPASCSSAAVSAKGSRWHSLHLAAALTTPLGAVVSYPFISHIDKTFLGALLALSAGALIYVGETHLLPQAEKDQKRYSLFAFIAGIAVAVIIV